MFLQKYFRTSSISPRSSLTALVLKSFYFEASVKLTVRSISSSSHSPTLTAPVLRVPHWPTILLWVWQFANITFIDFLKSYISCKTCDFTLWPALYLQFIIIYWIYSSCPIPQQRYWLVGWVGINITFFSATPHSIRDLSSPTRDQTCAPCIGRTES